MADDLSPEGRRFALYVQHAAADGKSAGEAIFGLAEQTGSSEIAMKDPTFMATLQEAIDSDLWPWSTFRPKLSLPQAGNMKIVKRGRQMQDGGHQGPTDIVGLDYDFWYAARLVAGDVEFGEDPLSPGDGGLLYYVRIRSAGESDAPGWIDSEAYATVEEAMAKAESMAWTGISPAVDWE